MHFSTNDKLQKYISKLSDSFKLGRSEKVTSALQLKYKYSVIEKKNSHFILITYTLKLWFNQLPLSK